jgi:hypothetical protein
MFLPVPGFRYCFFDDSVCVISDYIQTFSSNRCEIADAENPNNVLRYLSPIHKCCGSVLYIRLETIFTAFLPDTSYRAFFVYLKVTPVTVI